MSVFTLKKISGLEAKYQNRVESTGKFSKFSFVSWHVQARLPGASGYNPSRGLRAPFPPRLSTCV